MEKRGEGVKIITPPPRQWPERIYSRPTTRSQSRSTSATPIPSVIEGPPLTTAQPDRFNYFRPPPLEEATASPPQILSWVVSPSQFGLENPQTLPSILEDNSDKETFHQLPQEPEDFQDFFNREGQHLIYSADTEEYPTLLGQETQEFMNQDPESMATRMQTTSSTRQTQQPDTQRHGAPSPSPSRPPPSREPSQGHSQTRRTPPPLFPGGNPPSQPPSVGRRPLPLPPPSRRGSRHTSSTPSFLSIWRPYGRHTTPAIQNVPGATSEKEVGQWPPVYNGVTPQFKTWWMTVKNYIEMN